MSELVRPMTSTPPNPAGWARADSDFVLRGWVRDRSDTNARFEVDVLIDGEIVARASAVRFDPKLVELGEGDGTYAFVVIIPPSFRDGDEHHFEVHAPALGYSLRAKANTFTVPADASVPRIDLEDAQLLVMRGSAMGGHKLREQKLDAWDGDRLACAGLETRWSPGEEGWMRFEAQLPPRCAPARLAGSLRVGLPGMMEGKLTCPTVPPAAITFDANQTEDGQTTIKVYGVVVEPSTALEVLVQVPNAAPQRSLIKLMNGFATLAPTNLSQAGRATVRVQLSDGVVLAETVLRQSLRNLTANGDFRLWAAHGPTLWSLGEHLEAQRSYHSFGAKLSKARELSGDSITLKIKASSNPRLLLSQALNREIFPGDSSKFTLIARASTSVTLSIQVVDRDGEEVARADASLGDGLVWRIFGERLQFACSADGGLLRLLAMKGEAVDIEVAGFVLGAEAFGEPQPAAASGESTCATLTDWPCGLIFDDVTGRREIARSWWCANLGAGEGARVRAMLSEDPNEPPGLIAAAVQVPNLCRLEGRVTIAAADPLEGILRLDAGVPKAAQRLFGTGAGDTSVIDRVAIIRREMIITEGVSSLIDGVEAIVARNLAVSEALETLRLPFRRKPPMGRVELSDAEYFLVFDFRQPFAIALREPSLTFGVREIDENPYLELEDRNIRLQADRVIGLNPWLSPTVVRPVDAASDIRSTARHELRPR